METETFLGLFNKERSIIVFIVAVTGLFFWQVIIPINNIQLQLTSIQSQLIVYNQNSANITQDQASVKLQLATLQLQVANLQKILKQ